MTRKSATAVNAVPNPQYSAMAPAVNGPTAEPKLWNADQTPMNAPRLSSGARSMANACVEPIVIACAMPNTAIAASAPLKSPAKERSIVAPAANTSPGTSDVFRPKRSTSMPLGKEASSVSRLAKPMSRPMSLSINPTSSFPAMGNITCTMPWPISAAAMVVSPSAMKARLRMMAPRSPRRLVRSAAGLGARAGRVSPIM